MLKYALDLPADFEPNKDYGYSNTNYLLLSRIIEYLTGGSRQDYFKKETLFYWTSTKAGYLPYVISFNPNFGGETFLGSCFNYNAIMLVRKI